MSDFDKLDFDLNNLEKSLNELQNDFGDGLNAMPKTSEMTTENMSPTHEIIIDAVVSANVDSRQFKIDAKFIFEAELEPILDFKPDQLSSILSSFSQHLDNKEQSQALEQLSKPRCIGRLADYQINEFKVYSKSGLIYEQINQQATLLITMENHNVQCSFESVYNYAELMMNEKLYVAIPSNEKMLENVVVHISEIGKEKAFSWTESDKDNLKVEGKILIKIIE